MKTPLTKQHETRWSVILWRSLDRLQHAIKDCARIGFQVSSPTTNAGHAEVWNNLNDAQKDAALKLEAYSKLSDDPGAISSKEESPRPSDERNGCFLDGAGCCKVCDGEIPYGHQEHCDIWNLERKNERLRAVLRDLADAVSHMRVPQTPEDAALQITFTLGPPLRAAQAMLSGDSSQVETKKDDRHEVYRLLRILGYENGEAFDISNGPRPIRTALRFSDASLEKLCQCDPGPAFGEVCNTCGGIKGFTQETTARPLTPPEKHPLNDENGVRHSSRCARWFTPAGEVARRACNCGAEKASMPHIHVWQKAPDSGLALCACGDYSDDWYCPESPDHVCHYRKGDFDQCDYCGQPEERK